MQVVVFGMHRSGTSAVARLVNMMGAYIGPEGSALSAQSDNQKGFWERRDVRNLNDQILRSVGAEWNIISDFSPALLKEIPSEQLEEFQSKAKEIIINLDSNRPWVLKDPRLCLLFHFWKPLFEIPKAIVVVRNPLEVALSLNSRNGFPIEIGLALWEKYSSSLFQSIANVPTLLVSHQELMSQPVETVASIHQELTELGVDCLRLPKDEEIRAFIDSNLYRSRAKDQDLEQQLNNKQFHLWQSICAKDLRTLTSGLIPSEEGKLLLQDYERKLHNVGAVSKMEERLKAKEEECNALKEKLKISSTDLLTLQTELETKSEEETKLQLRLKELENQKQKLSSQHEELKGKKDELDTALRSHLETEQNHKKTIDKTLRDKSKLIENLEKELDSHKAHNVKLSTLLTNQENALLRLRQELTSNEQQLEFVSSRLEQLRIGVMSVFQSLRWRIGSKFVGLMRRLLFRPRKPSPLVHISQMFDELQNSKEVPHQ